MHLTSLRTLDFPVAFAPVVPAGTPLGDPIEVGAALAVFTTCSKQQPGLQRRVLQLAAAKSALGHAEPAAGAVGMLRAMHGLHSGAAAGILHLTALNPHVVDALEQQPAGRRALWMPRACGCTVSQGSGGSGKGVAGISGFAFQGTNAHVLLGRYAWEGVGWWVHPVCAWPVSRRLAAWTFS